MAEYDMPIEEQMKSIAKELRVLSETMRSGFAGIDARFDGVNKRFDGVDKRFDGVDKRLDGVDKRLDGVDKRLDGVDKRLDGADKRFDGVDNRLDKLQMLGEQTNAIARLSLEGIEGLRESTNVKFAEAAKANSEQTELLKSLFVHVRKRVDVIEPKVPQRPKTRRRRS
jgi:archaellum component FlaC